MQPCTPFPAPELAAQHPAQSRATGPLWSHWGGGQGHLYQQPHPAQPPDVGTAKQQPRSALLASPCGPQPVALGAKWQPPSLVAGSSQWAERVLSPSIPPAPTTPAPHS